MNLHDLKQLCPTGDLFTKLSSRVEIDFRSLEDCEQKIFYLSNFFSPPLSSVPPSFREGTL